ncbi:MAG: BrnT family toxin [Candidatus Omnitrophica bacterium]|nr:BrnT family toxin [Candidatus Omnitrophota bacterium]
MTVSCFDWDQNKDRINQEKHGVAFVIAQLAFLDPNRIIAKDMKHSKKERRYYCIGKVDTVIITVRFNYRKNIIRIIGAGYWRKGKVLYEKKNKIH